MKIFFDGSFRPAPHGAKTAVVVRGRSHIEPADGAKTSLDAEWRALLHAARLGESLGLRHLVFLGDCAAVIDQANGHTRARGTAALHLAEFRKLAVAFDRFVVRRIGRSQNLAGIALDRLPLR